MKSDREKEIIDLLKEINDKLDRMPINNDTDNVCSECGINFDGVTGYVCNNSRCPTVPIWRGG